MDEFDKINAFSQNLSQNPPKEEGDDAAFYTEETGLSTPFSPMNEEMPPMKSNRFHFIMLGLFVVILGSLLVVILLFSKKSQTNETIVIMDTNEPVKTVPAPEEQGGEYIPNQDKMVYDRIRSEDINTKVETMFPEIEQPMLPVATKKTPDQDFVALEEVKPVNPLNTQELEEKDMLPAPVVVKEQAAPKTESLPLVVADPQEQQGTQIKGWTVQLMSTPEKAKAEAGYKTLVSKHKTFLAGLPHQVIEANIPNKGTFYRVRFGDFKTRDEALALCKKLKARHQDCIPAK